MRNNIGYWKSQLLYARDWPDTKATRSYRRFAKRQGHKAERAVARATVARYIIH